MEISVQTLNDFVRFFSGNKNAYGVHIYTDSAKENGKKTGKSWTETKPVTEQLYIDHLEGKKGLGIIPIMPDDNVNFCVIDIDTYETKHESILNAVFNYSFPLCPFRSKSGGLHLYLFFEFPVPAKNAISLLKKFIPVFALDKKTEIFPKQKTIAKDGTTGTWINLPYYNSKETAQYLFSSDGSALDCEQAVRTIKSKLTSIEKVNTFLESLPLFDAPPCLQSIFLKGDTEFRNNYLFSLARYYKAKNGDDFEFKLLEANVLLKKPLDTEELSKTVINTHKKKDYSYRCSDAPICDICYRDECSRRKYGIGGTEVSELSFEEFQKHATDPPFYVWIINGKSLRFYSESDIIKQNRFRELCFRELFILPYRIQEVNWTKIVNNALKNVVVKEIAEEDDMSSGALLKEFLVEFLTRRASAQTKEQIVHDRVFRDEQRQSYIFKSKNLLSFLIGQKQFRYFSLSEIQDRIKRMGAALMRYFINSTIKNIRVWELPFSAIAKFVDKEDKETEIVDFDVKEQY
jgi:hypothetical protein